MKAAFRVLVINILLLLPVLYGFELFLRLRLNVEPRDTYLRLGWRPLMPVWMGEVSALQDRFRVPMLGAVPNSRTFLCDDGYGSVVYDSDHLGFRSSSVDYQGGAPYDIVIVGDSFMHGWCHADALAERLREKGRKVVNTAIAGSHPYQYRAALRTFVSNPAPPRNLILGIYLGNDYGSCPGCASRYSIDNPSLKKLYTYSNSLEMHQLLKSPSVDEYLKELKSLQELKTNSFIAVSTWQIIKLGEVRQFLRAIISPKRSDIEKLPDSFTLPINSAVVKNLLAEFVEICSPSTDCRQVLVSIPSNEAGESPQLRDQISLVHNQLVKNLMQQYPYLAEVDLRKPLGGSASCAKPLYDSPGKHLSRSGQECLNDLVLNQLL